jgi:hypothetical protein
VAVSVAGVRITNRYRGDQVAIRAALLKEVLGLWALLNPANLGETAGRWLDLMVELVLAFRTRSVASTVDYYQRLRAAELGADAAPLNVAALPALGVGNPAQVRTSLAVTGPVGLEHRIVRRGMEPAAAAKVALVEVSGAASRHALNGGREVVMSAHEHDHLALGFARLTGPKPCAFCVMLASRGPVLYTSRAAALRTTTRSKRGEGHDYHDNCMCTAEPVFFRDAEPPGLGARWQQLWKDATKGYSGTDALNALRRALAAQRRDEA